LAEPITALQDPILFSVLSHQLVAALVESTHRHHQLATVVLVVAQVAVETLTIRLVALLHLVKEMLAELHLTHQVLMVAVVVAVLLLQELMAHQPLVATVEMELQTLIQEAL
jgi:hypothetical protein